jgi:hypothetical protein
MIRFQSAKILMLLIALVAACAPGAAAPEPTATLEPVASPTFTAVPPTPVPPTASPTAVPATETPAPTANATATAAAAATATAEPIIAMIEDELQQYGLSTEIGRLGWLHDEVSFELENYLESQAHVDYPDLTASDFVMHADITWETTTGLAGCGFLLRAAPDFERGKQYQFAIVRLAGSPLWDIEYFEHGNFQYNLTGLRGAPALDESLGGLNRVTVIAQGHRFSAYANGVELGSVSDTKLTTGTPAFLAWQESGRTSCQFNNAWLWVLKD